jgi:hypothetical protein
MQWRAFAIGIALGLLAALAPSCDPSRPRCELSNCDGCCDAQGQCHHGDTSDACGVGANACVACGAGHSCQGNVCVDGGTDAGGGCGNCNTCCSNGTCVTAVSNSQCGSGGSNCVACGGSQTCQGGHCAGQCQGCLDNNSVCQPGTSNAACGINGGSCTACAGTETCNGQTGLCQQPQCTTASCQTGCCTATTPPQCVSAQPNDINCGTGGGTCQTCIAGQSCQGGQCVTQGGDGGSASCKFFPLDAGPCGSGCCDLFNTCRAGISDFACGMASVCNICATQKEPDGGPKHCVNQQCQ